MNTKEFNPTFGTPTTVTTTPKADPDPIALDSEDEPFGVFLGLLSTLGIYVALGLIGYIAWGALF